MDVHLTDSYFVIAHFHYVMVGGAIMGFMGGLHLWWPKISGRMYNEAAARVAAIIIFIGFNLTFFPQFILGYLGMPRSLSRIPLPEFQVLNVLSSAGASILGVGYLIPFLLSAVVVQKRARLRRRIRGARPVSNGIPHLRRRPRTLRSRRS